MSEHATEERERAEVEMLLPWYVTDRLDHSDKAKVDDFLARHPDMAVQLDLVRAEREQSVLGNEALGAPAAGALDRLMASLPAARPGLAQRIAGNGIWRQVTELFTAPTARGLRWAAIAAAVLIVVQAAAIATLLVRDGNGAYQTASGQAAGEGVLALVVFADDARAGAIAQLLAEFEANVVDGPKPGGVYKIRLRTEDRSEAARDALLRRLAERRDIVRTVLPSRE
jgi:flagellar basal body-associated protein FliL